MIRVYLDQKPTRTGSAHRGVGMYTKFLFAALQERKDVELVDSIKKADIIHYPYFDFFFHTLSLRKTKPTVITIHDVIPLLFPMHYPRGLKGNLRFWQQYAALHNVKAVITDSHSSANDITRFLRIDEKKIFPIYLAGNPNVSNSPYTPTSGSQTTDQVQITKKDVEKKLQMWKKLKLPKKYMLYVGDINYNKNIPQLIKALKFLPESIALVCAGRNFFPQPIPEWKAIETQLALSNVEHRVRLVTNFGDDPDFFLSALYGHALCYVQPSLYEGFGLPVLEAMQCQTPVISTRNSSLIEIGSHHVEYVQGTEAEDMAEAIKNVLAWPVKRRAQRIASALQWAKHFSWQKTAAETVEVYKKVLR